MTLFRHIPVMLREMCEVVSPKENEIYIDGTFGGGGYTQALFAQANCFVIGVDRDEAAYERSGVFMKNHPERFRFIYDSFRNLHGYVDQPIDALILDLGVSSFQLDEAERGFSFRFEGPLDMRMSSSGLTAAVVVNTYSEEKIEQIIREYGEESYAHKIARAIVERRRVNLFETTTDLADLIASLVPRKSMIHPATKVFQALRVYVNDELFELYECLNHAHYANRIVIVTFQGLEVRVIKQWYRSQTYFKEIKRLKPSYQEIRQNPRARSAELRVFERQK